MNKKLLSTLMLILSSAAFACPLCNMQGFEYDEHHEENTPLEVLKNSNFTGKHVFNHSYFDLSYSTPLWQKELGKNAVFPFFDHENKGDLEIKAGTRVADKHIFYTVVKTGIDIVPAIYNDKDHEANLKKYYTKYIDILKDKAKNLTDEEKKDPANLGRIFEAIKKLNEMQNTGVSANNKVILAPTQVVDLKEVKLGYEYDYNDEATLNVNLKITPKNSFIFDFTPSYDFASYIKENDYVKVKNLKLVNTYSFNSKYILGHHFLEKQHGIHNISIGADAKFVLPYDINLDIDMSKFFNVKAKYDRDAHLHNRPRYDKMISGKIKIALGKDFELYKDDKNELTLSNKFSWQPEWVWNEKSKTFKETRKNYIVYEEEVKLNYPTKFLKDTLQASTKLAYNYKINDEFTLQTALKLKYEGVKDRITKDAKRVNKFSPTALIGIKYNHNFNANTSVYGELNTEFLNKDIYNTRTYVIEPRFKAGIKYSY